MERKKFGRKDFLNFCPPSYVTVAKLLNINQLFTSLTFPFLKKGSTKISVMLIVISEACKLEKSLYTKCFKNVKSRESNQTLDSPNR